MPELPEVETVRRTLTPQVIGRTITRVALDWPGCDARVAGASLVAALPGATCLGVERRGKYLLLGLDGDRTLVVHLRMTGRLVVVGAGTPALRHRRASLELDDGRAIAFCDQRKFGRLALAPDSTSLAALLGRLGPEPEPHAGGFTTGYLQTKLAGRRAPVKSILLDQRVVAGLGNIYVDEALFVAGVHPSTPSGSVDIQAISRLVDAVVSVLAEAIADGGTTLADYRDANGETGSHQSRLNVFRRHGLPCRRCGATIERSVVAQRGTHACPVCQPQTPVPWQ